MRRIHNNHLFCASSIHLTPHPNMHTVTRPLAWLLDDELSVFWLLSRMLYCRPVGPTQSEDLLPRNAWRPVPYVPAMWCAVPYLIDSMTTASLPNIREQILTPAKSLATATSSARRRSCAARPPAKLLVRRDLGLCDHAGCTRYH